MTHVDDTSVTADWQSVAEGTHHDPHSILGAHPVKDPTGRTQTVIRVRRPLASAVAAVFDDGTRSPLTHVAHGIWETTHAGSPVRYRVATTYGDEPEGLVGDPYRHAPTLGELDIHLLAEGRHERLWDVLGAHHRELDGETGTSFAVWAPNASAVRIVGDHNGWAGEANAMRSMGGSGIWELFVPGVEVGTRYKFQIRTRSGEWIMKADPLARWAEVPPDTASVVTASSHAWSDGAWMTRRAATHAVAQPLSVYEVHVGSWRGGLGYREIADPLIQHVTETGFTHVEFMPLAEHPFGGSWGYQVSGYYSPTSRFGTPDDLRYLIDRLHQAGIGVIVDWVPGHFPKDAFALARFDGQPLYEHPDPRRGEHQDWGTLIFDYGRPEVKNFLVANALYWFEEFHVDGLRVDAVASMLYLDYSRNAGEWEPNIHGGRENLEAIRFLQEVNATSYRLYPGIMMIAEESTSFPGVTAPTSNAGLGFGFKWNMGWMNDSLRYLALNPFHRQYHHNEMTFAMVYQYSENFVLPISHDEVVHGKGSMISKVDGDDWQQFATLRAFYSYMWAFPGKQLVFMGQEFGQRHEFDESASLEWFVADLWGHGGLKRLFRDLNHIYRAHSAMWQLDTDPAGFQWLDADDAGENMFSWLRRDAAGQVIACFTNFSPNPQEHHLTGLPCPGVWKEILNTDSASYDGTGQYGNLGQIVATDEPYRDFPASGHLVVPPMGSVWLEYQGTDESQQEADPDDGPQA